jgi:hypothetical protein
MGKHDPDHLPKDKYRFLHLSDIHFGQERDGRLVVYDDIRAQLLSDCKARAEESTVATDGILITGDVAFRGSPDEYKVAGQWIDDLATAVGCDVLKVRTIPGNHDIDRTRIQHSCHLAHADMHSKQAHQVDGCLIQLLEEGEQSPILRKLDPYREFASRFGCYFESVRRPLWRHDYHFRGGGTLAFVGMNSVQVSDHQDAEGKMVLGNEQYVLAEQDGVEYVVLVHHPLHWLKDRLEAKRYLMKRARVLVVGHEHDLRIEKVSDVSGAEQLQLYAGALTPPEQELDFRYNWIEFSLVENTGSVRLKVAVEPRMWDRNTKEFTLDYARAQGNLEQEIACPKYANRAVSAAVLPAESAPGGGELDPMSKTNSPDTDFERLQYFFWTYLDWNARLTALVTADVLPSLPAQPMPQTLERLALEKARSSGKLSQLWEAVMTSVPLEKRIQNPYESSKE